MNNLAKHISNKIGLGDSKSEAVAKEVEILMEKLLVFKRSKEIYKYTIDKAVVRDYLKTLK